MYQVPDENGFVPVKNSDVTERPLYFLMVKLMVCHCVQFLTGARYTSWLFLKMQAAIFFSIWSAKSSVRRIIREFFNFRFVYFFYSALSQGFSTVFCKPYNGP